MILPYAAIVLLAFATVYAGIVSFRKPEAAATSWIFPTATSRPARIIFGAFSLALLIALTLWFGLSAHHSSLRSSRFLIPGGYTGWIRVEFEVQGAPPLPMEAGGYILRVPDSGALQTSSAEQYGWAKDRYYYYSAEGMYPIPNSGGDSLIWGRINGEAAGVAGRQKYEEFFVGTAQQFKNQAKGKN
ncbi:MAG: hypothetical protein WBV69_22335 [Candidatus Sulfotelmatobacter sp.]